MMLCRLLVLCALFDVAYCDYKCACNYITERDVYTMPSNDSSVVGYMYEFDCKPIVTESANWLTVAFEHQLGYVETDEMLKKQICQGDYPDADKITNSSTTTAATLDINTTLSNSYSIVAIVPSASTAIQTTNIKSTLKPSATTSYTVAGSIRPTTSSAPIVTSTANTTTQTSTTPSVTSTARTTTQTSAIPTVTSTAITTTQKSATPSVTSTARTTTQTSAIPTVTSTAITTTQKSATPSVTSTARTTTQTSAIPTVTSTARTRTQKSATPSVTSTARTTTQTSAIPTVTFTAITTTQKSATPSVTSTARTTTQTSAIPTVTSTAITTTQKSATPSVASTAITTTQTSAIPTVTSTAITTTQKSATPSVASTAITTTQTDTTIQVTRSTLHECELLTDQSNTVFAYSNNCYEFDTQHKTFKVAEDDCMRKGGHLAHINNDKEQQFLTSNVKDYQGGHYIWIGLHDTTHEEHFEWLSGEPVSYTHWFSGRKNFLLHGSEDCVALKLVDFFHGNDGTWDDLPCNRAYAYICQYGLQSVPHIIG